MTKSFMLLHAFWGLSWSRRIQRVCRFSKRVLLLPKINFAVGECIFWRQWFSLAVFKEQFPGISEPVLLFLKTIQKKSLYCKTRITQLIRKDQCMSAFFLKKKGALKNGILSNALLNACKYGSLFRMPLKAFSLWKLPFWRKPKERERFKTSFFFLALNYEKDGPQVFSKRFYRVQRGLTAHKSHFGAVKGFVFS